MENGSDRKPDTFFLSNKKQIEKKLKNKSKPQINKNQGKIKKKQQGAFDIDFNGVKKDSDKETKKPFDKKTYRIKKYSKKYKLEQWEEQRKKKLLNEYYKEVKNEPGAGTYKPISFDSTYTNTEVGRFVRHPDIMEKENISQKERTKKDSFEKSKDRMNKIKQDKLEKKQAKEKAIEEKKQKLQEYKKKKHERFKKLSKKTKKGQPVMTGRLELLLEKIQKG